MNHLTTALLLVFGLGCAGVGTAQPAHASGPSSYDVLCVEHKVPGDPRPYQVCVPYPL
jgi:hypothetical protein